MFQKKKLTDYKNFDDNFKVYNKVAALNNLNWTHKMVLSLAISYQINGQDFRLTSKYIAKQFAVTDGTIDRAFAMLSKLGFIITRPYNNGKNQFNLREVHVIDVEKLVYKDEYLTSIGWKPSSKIDPKQSIDSSVDKTIINADLPKTQDLHQSEEKSIEPIGIIEDTPANASPIQQMTLEDDFDIRAYLTPKMLEWAEKEISRDDKDMKQVKSMGYSTIQEMFYDMDKQEFNDFFYNDNGVWYYKTYDEDGCDWWQNINGINYLCQVPGARFTLFTSDENDKKKDSYQLDPKDFQEYFENKQIDFGQLTSKDFNILRQKEKQPLKMYQ